MGTVKHTPGPWKLSLTDDTVVVDATGREVAAIDGDYNDPDTWPLMEANARLIAAAPDLLGVLQRYMAAYPAFRIKPSGAPGSEKRIEQESLMALEDAARAAIVKAGGE